METPATYKGDEQHPDGVAYCVFGTTRMLNYITEFNMIHCCLRVRNLWMAHSLMPCHLEGSTKPTRTFMGRASLLTDLL